MTALQRLQLEQSRLRQRMNELLGKSELTNEERAELDTAGNRMQALEPELRAATLAETPADERVEDTANGEDRERQELKRKANVSLYLKAALEGKQLNGAEAEYAAAERCAGNVPLALFEPEPEQHRADAATTPPGTVGLNIQPIRPAIFARSIASRLDIEMPRVESGTFVEARISTSLTANSVAKGDDAESTAAAFTVSSATPKRTSARLTVRIEDLAAVGIPAFEASLRQNLEMALDAELDDQMINGDSATDADDINGLFKALSDPTDPTAVVDFDNGVATFADMIDGHWAETIREVRAVCGVAAYRKMAQTFQGTSNKSDQTLIGWLSANTGGIFTNSRMPAADGTSHVQQAIALRTGRQGIRKSVVPHWGYLSIDDVQSGSASGTRHFTVHVLLGDLIVVQPSAYAQIAFKTA